LAYLADNLHQWNADGNIIVTFHGDAARLVLGDNSYDAMDRAGVVMCEPTPHATVAKILQFTLAGGIMEQISCPTLVLDAEEDIYLKGQPDVRFEHLTCRKTMMRFTTAESAQAHCQCGADRISNARI
jgi:hypothetical protein